MAAPLNIFDMASSPAPGMFGGVGKRMASILALCLALFLGSAQAGNVVINPYAFGGGNVAYVDDGDHAPTSGTGTSSHTFASKTSTGPTTLLLLTYDHDADRTVSSITFDGNACTIAVQVQSGGGEKMGAAIARVTGGQSGNIVVTFSGGVDASEITILSLSNLDSETPVDTDSASGESGPLSLSALNAPGAGGLRAFVYSNANGATAVSFSLGTEIADVSADGFRHAAGVHQANSADTITATGQNSAQQALVGVSMR